MLIHTNPMQEVGGTVAQNIQTVDQISFQGTVFSITRPAPQRVIDKACGGVLALYYLYTKSLMLFNIFFLLNSKGNNIIIKIDKFKHMINTAL